MLENRQMILEKIVKAEDKIKRGYATIEEIEEGIDEMHEVLCTINSQFKNNVAYIGVRTKLREFEAGKITPKDFNTAELIKEIIRRD